MGGVGALWFMKIDASIQRIGLRWLWVAIVMTDAGC